MGEPVYIKMAARLTYKSLVQNPLVSLGIDATELLSDRPVKTEILPPSLGPFSLRLFLKRLPRNPAS